MLNSPGDVNRSGLKNLPGLRLRMIKEHAYIRNERRSLQAGRPSYDSRRKYTISLHKLLLRVWVRIEVYPYHCIGVWRQTCPLPLPNVYWGLPTL